MYNNILVIATAAEHGGALTILRQFILEASRQKQLNFFVITSIEPGIIGGSNVKIIKWPNAKSPVQRLKLEYYALKHWSKKNGINFFAIISFQNTGIKGFKGVPQIIYYHNALPLTKRKWDLFNPAEFKFWFYKRIYPLFTRFTITEDTYFAVQAAWLKDALMTKFNISKERIGNFFPNVENLKEAIVVERVKGDGPVKLFYPALPLSYKNHIEILNALSLIKGKQSKLEGIKLVLTFEESDNLSLVRKAKELSVLEQIEFIGMRTFNEIIQLYQDVDIVVFPSTIETIGLPLIEAAMLGKKILAADMPYAREVLARYEGVEFIPVGAPLLWAAAIERSCKGTNIFPPLLLDNQNGWEDFFKWIDSISKNHKYD
jgi:glycosyltransferase involved in cell wall biosynthesis